MIWNFNVNIKNYGGGPKIKILWDNKEIFKKHFINSGNHSFVIETNNILPNKLEIIHYEKNMKKDTLLKDNKIVDDKALILNSILIDNIKLKYEIYLFDFITEDNKIMTNINYLGLNGKFIIDINNTNLFSWFADKQLMILKEFDFNYNEFRKEIFGI